ncbi:hypothetical protein PYCCODRAFT_1411808 [Trametes coccinea BRFM310]|uniref:Fungal-type protein kinase domain-containing protein n=1 Tax=Trametes coccinea (strain BRFM310) TaxID=1353009 RepID=A0A1Y2ILF0_TRAC3|nr:hypothetical protein PYCCODRAFT_1411808 [Trametes coccinea BRFM310]
MSNQHGACVAVVDLRDFEAQVFPDSLPSTTLPPILPVSLIKRLRELASSNGNMTPSRRKLFADTLVSGINKLKFAQGYIAIVHSTTAGRPDREEPVNVVFCPADYAQSTRRQTVDWTRAHTLMQFGSSGATCDPFGHIDEASSSSSQADKVIPEETSAAVESIFTYQHRTSLLSFHIQDNFLRMIRWDRGGVLVSKPIDYLKDPTVLPRLLSRFARLTDEQQGLDVSATRLEKTSAEYRLMNELGKDNSNVDIPFVEGVVPPPPQAHDFPATTIPGSSSMPKTSSPPSSTRTAASPPLATDSDTREFRHAKIAFQQSLAGGWPRYRLHVGEKRRAFLVAMPACSSTNLFGRGCRAYVAVDCATRRLVWLKESWRPANERSIPEGAILERFAGDSKLHVPTLVCHGFVQPNRADAPPNQVTQTPSSARLQRQRPLEPSPADVVTGKKRSRDEDDQSQADTHKRAKRAASPTPEYTHYRLVVKEIGLELEHFTSGWQLVRMIYECILTHSRAYREYGLLHGDISAGNILICPTTLKKDGKEVVVWRGMLIDWELARFVREDKGTAMPNHHDQTILTTWQYASLEAIRKPCKQTTVEDEIEAFFHVLLWYAVRFLRHTLPQPSVEPFVREFFDTFERYPSGEVHASDLKEDTIRKARLKFGKSNVILFCDDSCGPMHPLNGLLFELLRRLQARYAVMEWEEHAGSQAAELGPRRTHAVSGRHINKGAPPHVDPNDMLGDALRSGHRNARAPSQPLRPPSAKTLELARGLRTHTAVIKLFSKWMIDHRWPLLDKVDDQLPEDYCQTPRFVDIRDHTESGLKEGTNKRRKLAESGSAAAAAAST